MKRGLGACGPAALIALGLAAAAVGISYGVWESGGPGAGLLPTAAGLGIALFAAWVLVTEQTSPPAEEGTAPRRVVGYVIAVFGFALGLEPLGALVTVTAVFLWVLRGIERQTWRLTLVVTAAATAGAWLLFERLLDVPLPRGIWG